MKEPEQTAVYMMPDPVASMRKLRTALGIVSADDFAGALDVSRQLVNQWRREGVGPVPIMVGRSTVYRIEDVKTWLAVNAGASAGSPVGDDAMQALEFLEAPEPKGARKGQEAA